jgi:hypothetical protein
LSRRFDRIDAEIAARARSKRAFDLCEERPAYDPLGTTTHNLSRTSLEMAASKLGPAFTYNLYVHTIRLLQARNVVWSIVAHVQKNPFAPHVNIVECPSLDEGEWVLEANGLKTGSNFPW